MASITVPFPSSLLPTATLPLKHKFSSATKTCLSFPDFGFRSSHGLTFSSRRSLSPVPKLSESETSVIEVEPSEPDSLGLQVFQGLPPEEPKREEVFAVVMVRM